MRDTNRVDHVAWAVHHENIERYAAQLSDVFACEFEDVVSENAGVRAFVSWDAGLELCSPIPGNTNPAGEVVSKFLEEKGEGVCAVIVRIPDMAVALSHADSLGWPVDKRPLVPEPEILSSTMRSIAERIIGPFAGTALLFAEIDYKEDFLQRNIDKTGKIGLGLGLGVGVGVSEI